MLCYRRDGDSHPLAACRVRGNCIFIKTTVPFLASVAAFFFLAYYCSPIFRVRTAPPTSPERENPTIASVLRTGLRSMLTRGGYLRPSPNCSFFISRARCSRGIFPKRGVWYVRGFGPSNPRVIDSERNEVVLKGFTVLSYIIIRESLS